MTEETIEVDLDVSDEIYVALIHSATEVVITPASGVNHKTIEMRDKAIEFLTAAFAVAAGYKKE